MKRFRYYVIMAILLVVVPMYGGRPKVGLALGGGGAKGAATIGVLKVIESSGIKVDYVAGTSIGAIVGGLYAAGYFPEEMEELFLSLDWQDVAQGHRVEAMLKNLLDDIGVEQFSDTYIPFRCVAAEENSYEEVVLSSGILYKAIRASMSVPEIYEPVRWGNMYLVDGGVANNLPVDVVRDMGADIVIAVDLQQEPGFGISIPVGHGGVASWLLSRPDRKRREQNIKDADVYIHPDLYAFSAKDFGHKDCQIMLSLGEEEAMDHWDELIEIKNRQQYSSRGVRY